MLPKNELLKRLIDQPENKIRFDVFYSNRVDEPMGLLQSLGIEEEMLSDQAKEAIAAISEMVETDSSSWNAFLWRLTAFSRIQEIFDMKAFKNEGGLEFAEQYYFYFESRILLSESVLAGLNGLYNSSDHLLRPFLEFSILQNYYYRIIDKAGDYNSITAYFKSARNPSWSTSLKGCLPNDRLSKLVKFRLQKALGGLSDTVNHPYNPSFSHRHHRKANLGHSLEGLFFWHKIDLVVLTSLWTYYINFPLLFHPVEKMRKFGYEGQIGVVIDKNLGEVIRKSLSESDYKEFHEYSAKQEKTKGILEWFSGLPNLSDEKIKAAWDVDKNGTFPGVLEGYVHTQAQQAALRVMLAWGKTQPEQEDPDVIDKEYERVKSLT